MKLLDFRNTIAHGRSFSLEAETMRDNNRNLDKFIGERLLADWERLIQSSDFAERARADVGSVLGRLHSSRRDKKEALFATGIGSSQARLG